MRALGLGSVALGVFLLGCAPCGPVDRGTDAGEVFGKGGRSCGRGVALLSTDYMSTHVSLLGLDGETLSATFLSSASADTRLNAPLSGDVVFPSQRMKEEIVLIDRMSVGALTFADIETAEVRAQLAVRTGFDANPQDYVRLDSERALVTRLEKNPTPGDEPFDAGDDALVLDAGAPEIKGRIDFSSAVEDGARARPGRMLSVGDFLLVHLSGHAADFQTAEEARVAVLEKDSLAFSKTFLVEGMKNCGGMALSPDESRLLMSCSGLVQHSDGAGPENSGLVLYDLTAAAGSLSLTEVARVTAEEAQVGPFAPSVAFVDDERALVAAYGALEGPDAGRPDRVLLMDFEAETSQIVLETDTTPFSLESILCVEACDVCFAADADRRVVHRLVFEQGVLKEKTQHTVSSGVDLPPRLLGWF